MLKYGRRSINSIPVMPTPSVISLVVALVGSVANHSILEKASLLPFGARRRVDISISYSSLAALGRTKFHVLDLVPSGNLVSGQVCPV